MNTPGPATSVVTSVFGFRQNEHAAITGRSVTTGVTPSPCQGIPDTVRHYLTRVKTVGDRAIGVQLARAIAGQLRPPPTGVGHRTEPVPPELYRLGRAD